jgi:proline dehydrogenase
VILREALLTASRSPRVKRLVESAPVTRDALRRFMLYGVRPDEQRRLAAAGETVRVYVPYGTRWYGYLMRRRLAERPANIAFCVPSRRRDEEPHE